MNQVKDKTWIAGVVVAITASLCCITPVLALISGVGGIASTFSWLEPVRPYLIGITILILGFAWYQKLKPRKRDEVVCDCEEDEKPSFWQSKSFLGFATIIVISLLAFPNYSHIFYPKSPTVNVISVEKSNIRQVEFKISGMTCQSCTEHVNHALDGVPGVLEHTTSYEQGTSLVQFDVTKVNEKALVDAVDATGYTVTERKIIDIK
jgi:mercuric ion transport protein